MRQYYGIHILLALWLACLGGHDSVMAAEPRSGILLGDSLPASWSYDSGISQTSPGDDRWWEVFDDNTLVWLVRRAETSSYDLGSAY